MRSGVALEALGRFDDAIVDYEAVLLAQPEDPAGFNNLGNAYAGVGGTWGGLGGACVRKGESKACTKKSKQPLAVFFF
eukprot:195529-Chlamydomonas_euryale.AAC.8